MRSLKTIIFILISVFVLAGCSENAAKVEKKPDEINNVFLMYEEEYIGENDQSIGDLYQVTDNKEKEKIASRVKDGHFFYINSQNKVLFIDEDNKLYEHKKGKEKVKLADDVSHVNGDYSEGIITFENEDRDLYIIHGDKEEKISSSVYQYELIGDYIFFTDDDGDFSMYNIKDSQETEIANDVFYFTSLSDKEEIAYLDEDYSLFYKKVGDKESIKITSDEVSPQSIMKIGNSLVYYNVEDEESSELSISSISNGGTSKKIASDIRHYEYVDGYFYYVNNDDILYKKKESEDKSTKLASDVIDFTVEKDTIFYTDDDQKLFQLKDGEKPKKIASSVIQYDISPKGDLVYQTADYDLFVNDKKIASEIEMYKHYFGNLAFAGEDDKLYLMESLGEKKVIVDDLNEFSNAYYQNTLVFSNRLTFKDIEGVWKAVYDGEVLYLEINKDGTLVNLQTNEREKLETYYAGYHSITTNEATFSINDDDTLTLNFDDMSQALTKSTKAEAKEHYKKLQLEADKVDISYLMDQYLSNFQYAVNSGNEFYIDDYMASSSPFYKQHVDFIHNAYEKNVKEELVDYKIDNINNTADGFYTVECTEIFTIYTGLDDYEGQTKTFKNTYTIERINGQLLITNIKVAQTKNGASQ